MTNEYQDRANYYNNLHLIDDSITAVVHLEDEEDCLFWKPLLSHYGKGDYKYIYHTRDNNVRGGCEECLNYRPYLSPYFFICIDSDMRYILGEENINVQHYICQTYTYSIENHFCEASNLQKRFLEYESGFNFDEFLFQLSAIVYQPLLLLTHNLRNKISNFGIREFRACIPHQCLRSDLNNHAAGLLDTIRCNFNKYNFEYVDLSEEVTLLNSLGITVNNAYMHVRGHDIANLVEYIGNLFCKHIQGVSFKNNIYYNINISAKYWELNNIISDINELNKLN